MPLDDWHELAYTLFEEAGDALYLFDPESEHIQDVNPMAQRLSGFSRRDLLQMKITHLFRAEDAGGMQRLRQAFRRTGLFHSQEGFLLRHQTEGTWIPVNLTVTRLHAEAQTLGLVTVRDIREQRESMQQLRRMEAEMRRLTQSVSDCLWSAEVDPLGRWVYTYFSPVIQRITGRTAEFHIAGPDQWLSTVMPADRERVEQFFSRLRSGRTGYEEYRVLRQDGTLCWIRDSVIVTREPKGQTLLVDGILTDITERMSADETLRENEARLSLLLTQMPAAIWTTDADLRITSSSGAALAVLGQKQNETVGLTMAEAVHNADPEYLPNKASLQALRGESVSYTMEFGGRSWDTHIEPLRDHLRNIIGTIGVTLDITERIRTEESLRESEAKHRALIENLTQCVFLKDKELRYIAVNKPFCEVFGRTEAEILGRTGFDFFPPAVAERFQADDMEVLAAGKRIEREEDIELGGKPRSIRVVKSPMYDDNGSLVGVIGIFWDVTDQRNLEAQYRQAQKMEAVGQLAGGIAHDFNNLLTAVIGNLELFQAELGDHESMELLGNAIKAGYRAADLTRQILSFARQTALRPGPMSLNQCIDETVRLLRRTFDPRIHLHVNEHPQLWKVHADAAQMSQVLMNLCINARDAMPNGGTLTLETANTVFNGDSRRDPDADVMKLDSEHPEARRGEFVRLTTIDTGTGMSQDILEHLFEPFFTTKGPGKGTGLGLAMIFGIVKQHEGWIECHSEIGKGTRFDIYLPRLVDATASRDPVTTSHDPDGSETILLVDDHEMVLKLGLEILKRRGYKVLTASDGAEAVDIYRTKKEAIDLVVLDLAMPKMSGQETLKLLRQINPDVRVLVSSGHYTEQTVQAMQQDGIAGFVAKPYRPAQLAQSVRRVLDEARQKSK